METTAAATIATEQATRHENAEHSTRCRAKFMTCEIHDYDRSAHAHTMRMIDIGSEISQVDNNSTCVSCFGGNLCSFLKSCGFNFELSINCPQRRSVIMF